MSDKDYITTIELGEKYGYILVIKLCEDKEFLAEVSAGLDEFKRISFNLNWDVASTYDTLARVAFVYFAIENKSGSQNEICALAKLSPKTYRKHRDAHIINLKEQYADFCKVSAERLRNVMIEGAILFGIEATQAMKALDIIDYDIFLDNMEANKLEFTVNNVRVCYDILTKNKLGCPSMSSCP